MTWTYSGDPGSSRLDHVRFLIGDTEEKTLLISDEEIDFCLTENEKNDYWAAVCACEAAVAKLLTLGESKKAELKRKTCQDLKVKALSSTPMIYAGGIDKPKRFTSEKFP
jgi:hypothetical protein